MSNTAIKVENLSKIYRLGEIGTGTISRDMERWFKTKVLKQEDPFLKIGEINDRANKGNSDIVYSLRDINFEIEQGDAVGIIGRNGAGKSTLLKILSRVTTPTTGKINIKGRVASLLEVGTGFHPELTGRENIYLNGAILGMRKREIDRKLDEIIDFSGVERYIDTPVKRYSSGMYVRLAFAVAAHLESEILIVDEVLAVGDVEFQKKCLGKMGEVSKGEGRTVLFVSHNMGSIDSLCNRSVVLKNGVSAFAGTQKEGISMYLNSSFGPIPSTLTWEENYAPGDDRARLLELSVSAPEGFSEINFSSGVLIKATVKANITNQILDFSYNVKTEKQELLFHHGCSLTENTKLQKGNYCVDIRIPPLILNQGSYLIDAWLGLGGLEIVGKVFEDVIGFEVTANQIDSIAKVLPGFIRPKIEYRKQFNSEIN